MLKKFDSSKFKYLSMKRFSAKAGMSTTVLQWNDEHFNPKLK